ncbi:MAG: HisA/HisF-related TIM barrel protein [Isosphaeraceae bacterium]
MRVIPVLDLKAGQAVHALAGRRDHYQPVRTFLHEGSDPIDLALAYRDRLGLSEFYLADLDAIAGAPPALPLYRRLLAEPLTLQVDAGVRDLASVRPLLDAGVSNIVVALETLRTPDSLAEIIAAIGPARLVFSLDLRDGTPLIAQGADWGSFDPVLLADRAIGFGVQRLLLLDLARVGTGQGLGTLPLLATLCAAHPQVSIQVGGGISGPSDLPRLARAGASAALIGSALLDGRIGRDHLNGLDLEPAS